jgi:spore coat protein CotH
MMQEETKLVKQFDKDGDKRLNATERKAAREFLQKERAAGRGPRGFGGPGGGRGFGPGMMLASQMLSQADKNGDQKLTKEEFTALADAWFDKLDSGSTGKLNQEEFADKFSEVLPPPQGFGGPGGGGPPGGGSGFGPGRFIGPALFTASDADKDGSLTRPEIKGTFGKWFAEWDSDKSGSLNEQKIREGLNAVLPRPSFGGPGGPGGPGFRGPNQNQEPPKPGRKLSPADVKSFPNAPLYEPQTLRTYFLEFENTDWEKELSDFHGTDVEVPAKLTVDGKTYQDVGVHFRGMSSYGSVGEGRKRSLNLTLDFAHKEQQIGGYRTLNLLNAHEDPTFLRPVLFCDIAREYLPAPKANFARVVINGESWGIYDNVEQFNKDFVKEWFGTTQGARWKVRGNPGGQGSLKYLGDDPAAYKRIYTIKTKDDPKVWASFINLCKVLNETPADKLEQALAPLLNIDGALRFIALDNALINNDGYWIRTSDYSIYQDEKGRFHIIPADVNETFVKPGGPGFGGRGGGGGGGRGEAGGRGGPGFGGGQRINGVELDPLRAANDPNKPLISKLLAVPALRARYLGYVRDIAEKWLDWNKLGPIAERYHLLIAEEVKADTRKLDSTEDFEKALTEDIQGTGFGPSGGGSISLKNFADQRRAYLLNHPAVKKGGI